MECMQPPPGSLLIASATLVDPNFARCVLLILNSDEDGSLGVILNQPTETPVDEVLTQWRDVVNPPGVFFRGGPVELNAALAEASPTALKGEIYSGPYKDQLEVEEPQPGEDVELVPQQGGPQL